MFFVKSHWLSSSYNGRRNFLGSPELRNRACHKVLKYIIRKLWIRFATHRIEVLVHSIRVCEAEIYKALIPIIGPGLSKRWKATQVRNHVKSIPFCRVKSCELLKHRIELHIGRDRCSLTAVGRRCFYIGCLANSRRVCLQLWWICSDRNIRIKDGLGARVIARSKQISSCGVKHLRSIQDWR